MGASQKNILLIYHSQSGHNEKMALACLEGVQREEGVHVRFLKASEATLSDVIWSDGILIQTPEYFGNMAGAIKDFFDRTYYPAREKEIVRPLALSICCDNDGTGAERNLLTIANGYVLQKQLGTLIVKEKDLEASLDLGRELGQTFAAGIVLGIF